MSISQAQTPVQSFDSLFETSSIGHSSPPPLRLVGSANGAFFNIFDSTFEIPIEHVMSTSPVVRVGNLWLPRESLLHIERLPASQSPPHGIPYSHFPSLAMR